MDLVTSNMKFTWLEAGEEKETYEAQRPRQAAEMAAEDIVEQLDSQERFQELQVKEFRSRLYLKQNTNIFVYDAKAKDTEDGLDIETDYIGTVDEDVYDGILREGRRTDW